MFCNQTQADVEKKAPTSMTLSVIRNYRASSKQPHKFLPPQNSRLLFSQTDLVQTDICVPWLNIISGPFHSIEQKEKSCPLALSQGFPNFPDDKNHPGPFFKRHNLSSKLRATEPNFQGRISAPGGSCHQESLDTLLQVDSKCSRETEGLFPHRNASPYYRTKPVIAKFTADRMERQADDPAIYLPGRVLEQQGWSVLQSEWSAPFHSIAQASH